MASVSMVVWFSPNAIICTDAVTISRQRLDLTKDIGLSSKYNKTGGREKVIKMINHEFKAHKIKIVNFGSQWGQKHCWS